MKVLLYLAGGVTLGFGAVALYRYAFGSPVARVGQNGVKPTDQAAITRIQSYAQKVAQSIASKNAGGTISPQEAQAIATGGAAFLAEAAKGISSLASSSSPQGSALPARVGDQSTVVVHDTVPTYENYAEVAQAETPNINTGVAASSPDLTGVNSQTWGTDGTDLAAQDLTPGVTVAEGAYSDAIPSSTGEEEGLL